MSTVLVLLVVGGLLLFNVDERKGIEAAVKDS